jgi:hypothetical protein
LSSNIGRPIYFPSGIYLVQGTVFVPPGSVIIGELWPQVCTISSVGPLGTPSLTLVR